MPSLPTSDASDMECNVNPTTDRLCDVCCGSVVAHSAIRRVWNGTLADEYSGIDLDIQA
jgi:hypothetical protein